MSPGNRGRVRIPYPSPRDPRKGESEHATEKKRTGNPTNTEVRKTGRIRSPLRSSKEVIQKPINDRKIGKLRERGTKGTYLKTMEKERFGKKEGRLAWCKR